MVRLFQVSVVCFVSLLCVAYIALPTDASAASLKMRQFCVDKTTENGADESYIAVVGTRSDGVTFSARLPADEPQKDAGHWDMNDGDQPTDNPDGDSHCITNKAVISTELKPGQSLSLLILLMEEDENTEKIQDLAAAVLAAIGNPYTVAAAAVLETLTRLGVTLVPNSDEIYGSFGVNITNKDGEISAKWSSKNTVESSQDDPNRPDDDNAREYRMKGDGANVIGWFYVE